MKLLLTGFLLFFFISISAQRYVFKTLGALKDQKTTSDLTKFGNRYYGIAATAKSRMGWTVTLEKMKMTNKLMAYDEQVNPLREAELANGKEVYGPFSSQLKVLNNKLYFIYFGYEQAKGLEVYAAEVDTSNLSLSQTKRILGIDQKNVGLFKMMSLYNSFNFDIRTSPDGSKYLFLFFPGANELFFYTVTDNNLNKIREETAKIENAKDPLLQNCLVDNAANVFTGYKWKKKDHFYSGLIADISGVKKDVPLALTSGTPHDVYVFNGEAADQVRVCGTYSKDGYYINGAFSLTLDKKSLAVKGLVQKDIPDDMLGKIDKDNYAKTKKKDHGVFPEIHFEATELDNGTVVMAGDLIRYQSRGSGVNSIESPVGGTSLLLLMNKNDILIRRLPKREIMGDNSNNFFLHKRGNLAVLFYIDVEGNMDTPIDEAETAGFYSKKDNVIVAAKVEADGRISRKILYPDTPGNFYFSPSFATSLSPDSILMGLGKDKLGLTNVKTTQRFYLLNILDE